MESFKSSDLVNRLREKQRLETIYEDLEHLFGDTGHLRVEEELTPYGLNQRWSRMLHLMDERERLLRDRTGSQMSLQDLTHRLHQNLTATNERLDQILRRIEDAENRSRVAPTQEVRQLVDGIVDDLHALEAPIESYFSDVNVLKSERHPQAHDFYQQVFGLHQRRTAYLDRCQADLLHRLGQRDEYASRMEAERYLHVREQVFTKVEECIEWVEKRLSFIKRA
uniref:Uncharacterized protein n=1 Tax=Romanomermis culicivorax TaxID=13658 RepID=A0A915IMK0_ROMCU